MIHRFFLLFLGRMSVLLILFMLTGCDSAETSASGAPANDNDLPNVHTANYPLAYFAHRIGGPHIDLRYMDPDGDPAFWEPNEIEIAAMQKADLILLNGATYSKWLDHVSLPSEILVDTSAAFADQFIEIKEGSTHSHGAEGEHSHAGTAFTTWMDLSQAKQQAKAVLEALVAKVPKAQEDLEARAEALFGDLDIVDREFQTAAIQIRERPLMASHPVYQYFGRKYGLDIDSVLWEPETVPDDAAIQELVDHLKEHPAKWMIWEGDPAGDSILKLEALGLQSIVVNPCGGKPAQGDWLTVMYGNVAELQKIK